MKASLSVMAANGSEERSYRVHVRQTFEYDVELTATSKAEARRLCRNPANWDDWDEAGNWEYVGGARPTKQPVEVVER